MKVKLLCATAVVLMGTLTGCWDDGSSSTQQSTPLRTNACGSAYLHGDGSLVQRANQILDEKCRARLSTPGQIPGVVAPQVPSQSGRSSTIDKCGTSDLDGDGIGDTCDYTDDRDSDGDGTINSQDPYPYDIDNDSTDDSSDYTEGRDSDGDGVPNSSDSDPYDSSVD